MNILNKLGIKDINYGGCSGPGNWTKGKNDGLTESFNPSNGQLIASVYNCSDDDGQALIPTASPIFLRFSFFKIEINSLFISLTTPGPL